MTEARKFAWHHYQAIAEVLAPQYQILNGMLNDDHGTDTGSQLATLDMITTGLADMFARDNPRFDGSPSNGSLRNRFYRAAGMLPRTR